MDRTQHVDNPPVVSKNPDALRIGLLSASRIAPKAVIRPARSMPTVTVVGVAARDKQKAEKYAKEWDIPKVYDTYEALLADKDIDVIYNPLPNGLHFDWSMKALEAGKHVLLEKPATSNAEQAVVLQKKAHEKGLVLMEAFHNRFHPAMQKVKDLLRSGEYGQPQHMYSVFALGEGECPSDDIRYQYDLGGGGLMDLVYCISAPRYFYGKEIVGVSKASAKPLEGGHPKIDNQLEADLDFGNGQTAHVESALSKPGFKGMEQTVEITTNTHIITFDGYVLPQYYNQVTVRSKDSSKPVYQASIYKYDDQPDNNEYYATFSYQMECFRRRVLNQWDNAFWTRINGNADVDDKDMLNSMKTLDQIYEATGMGARI